MNSKPCNGHVLADQLTIWPTGQEREPEYTGDTATTVMGLDTSQVPVRMVITKLGDGGGLLVPLPAHSATFTSLAGFSDYWQQHWRYSGVRIALPADKWDPLKIRAWLEVRAYPIELYKWMAYRDHLTVQFADLDLCVHYERAYVLALYAWHRFKASIVARDLWAKLYEANHLLEEIRHQAHRLAASLPDGDGCCMSDIPF